MQARLKEVKRENIDHQEKEETSFLKILIKYLRNTKSKKKSKKKNQVSPWKDLSLISEVLKNKLMKLVRPIKKQIKELQIFKKS